MGGDAVVSNPGRSGGGELIKVPTRHQGIALLPVRKDECMLGSLGTHLDFAGTTNLPSDGFGEYSGGHMKIISSYGATGQQVAHTSQEEWMPALSLPSAPTGPCEAVDLMLPSKRFVSIEVEILLEYIHNGVFDLDLERICFRKPRYDMAQSFAVGFV